MDKDFLFKLPEKYSILLTGPPGVGKLELLIHMMRYFAQKNEKIIFVALDVSTDTLKTRAAKHGLPLEKFASNFIILDGFTSTSLTTKLEGLEWSISSLTNLEALNVCLDRAVTRLGPPVKIFFYTISSLFLFNPTPIVYRFLKIFSTKVLTNYGGAFCAAHTGILEEAVMTTMVSFVEGVIEMKYDKNLQRYLRFHHMRGLDIDTKWRRFNVSSKKLGW